MRCPGATRCIGVAGGGGGAKKVSGSEDEAGISGIATTSGPSERTEGRFGESGNSGSGISGVATEVDLVGARSLGKDIDGAADLTEASRDEACEGCSVPALFLRLRFRFFRSPSSAVA